MEPQLNLLGDHAQPDDEQLGSVQRLVIRELRARGAHSIDEIGALIHGHRGRHPAQERCMWCGTDAEGLILALEHRGLVERDRHGFVRLADTGRAQPRPVPDEADVWPEGF